MGDIVGVHLELAVRYGGDNFYYPFSPWENNTFLIHLPAQLNIALVMLDINSWCLQRDILVVDWNPDSFLWRQPFFMYRLDIVVWVSYWSECRVNIRGWDDMLYIPARIRPYPDFTNSDNPYGDDPTEGDSFLTIYMPSIATTVYVRSFKERCHKTTTLLLHRQTCLCLTWVLLTRLPDNWIYLSWGSASSH